MNTTLAQSLTSEVIQLVADLGPNLSAAKRYADASVITAWKIGGKCLQAKKEVGHGNFLAWLQGVGIPQQTAHRYMQLATNYPTLSNLEEANAKRAGYLTLIVPEKEQVEHEGDVDLAPQAHHNVFINAFMKWKRRIDIGKLSADKERLREDMKPIRDWINELYA